MRFPSFSRLFEGKSTGRSSTRGKTARKRSAERSPRRSAVRLGVEYLEDRTLMSVLPAPVSIDQTNLIAQVQKSFPGSLPGNHSTPSIIIDPSNSNNLIAVFQADAGATSSIQGIFSTNAGTSWSPFPGGPDGTIATQNGSGQLQDPTQGFGSNFTEYTNPSVSMDGNEQIYVAYAAHRPDNSAGAIVVQKYDFSTGVPTLVTPANPDQIHDPGVVYEWAAAADTASDPALNPVVVADANLASFTDPQTGATQADPLIDTSINPATSLPRNQGMVYVAWNTNYATPANPGDASTFTPSSIKIVASSDGGITFTNDEYANSDGELPNHSAVGEKAADPQLAISQGTTSSRSTPITVTSISRLGTTASVTTSSQHGFLTGDQIAIAGAVPSEFDGTFIITVTGTNTFTYTMPVNATTPVTASGSSITATKIAIPGGQLNLIYSDFGRGQIRSASIDTGGTGAVFTDTTQTHINDAVDPGNSAPHIPGVTLLKQSVSITDPNFTTASDLTVTVNLFHANLEQLQIRLLPVARIKTPFGIAFGPDGNLYAAGNSTNDISVYDGNTGAFLRVFADSSVGVSSPDGIAFDPQGNLYVANTGTSQILRFKPDGTPFPSGNNGGAVFYSQAGAFSPAGLVFIKDLDGDPTPVNALPGQVGVPDLAISDSFNNQVIVVDTETGTKIKTLVASGAGGLTTPAGLAVGPDGNLYVASTGDDSVKRYNAVTGASLPSGQNPGATFATQVGLAPQGIAFGPDGNLYVASANAFNGQIVRFNGPVHTGPGTAPQEGNFLDDWVNSFNLTGPHGILFKPSYNPTLQLDANQQNVISLTSLFFVSDAPNDDILRYDVVPGVPEPASGIASATDATLVAQTVNGPNLPHSMVLAVTGNPFSPFNLVVANTASNLIQVYNAQTGAFVSSFQAGNGLLQPWGISLQGSDYFVSSNGNDRILEYDSSTQNFVSTFVVQGAGGLSQPTGMAFGPPMAGEPGEASNDPVQELYVASFGNDSIMRYDGADGSPLPVTAGNGAIFVTKSASVPLSKPTGLAFDPARKTLYVSSSGNNQILEFDAQTGTFKGVLADSTDSPLSSPGDLTFGPDGTLYVTSTGNNRVLRFNVNAASGKFLGTYMESIVPADNNAANNGGLSGPYGLVVSPDTFNSAIWVTSLNNNKIMRYFGPPAIEDGSAGNPGPVFVVAGGGGVPVTLLNNHLDSLGNARGNLGIKGGANLGLVGPNNNNLHEVGTVFDQNAPRAINDGEFGGTAAAPFASEYRPEDGSLNFGGLLSLVGPTATKAVLNGEWTLEITDFRSNISNGVQPNQFVASWSMKFTSRLTPNLEHFVATGASAGNASEAGSTISVNGAAVGSFPNAAAALAAPDRGTGPTPSVAVDNTLGSFSPFQGRIYVAYTSGAAGASHISLVTSDDGGITWLKTPVRVDDDSAADNFSEGTRPQFDPAVAVDQATGTLVISFYDTRNDASRSRVATYLATSLDGGWTTDSFGDVLPDFAPETYVNLAQTAIDAITDKTVIIGPIPDNNSANGAGDKTFDYGDRQGLAVSAGHIYPLWAGNFNGGGLGILSAAVTIAAGPRIVSSTMGAVQTVTDPLTGAIVPGYTVTDDKTMPTVFSYDNQFSPDGVQEVNGFVVTFDRPIDVASFDKSNIQVMYRDTVTPAGVAPTLVDPSSYTITPLQGWTTLFGPAHVGGINPATNEPYLSTTFLVEFTPQAGTGTYSYAINPTGALAIPIRDKIRSIVAGLPAGTPLPPLTISPNALVPPGAPTDTGGHGLPGPNNAPGPFTSPDPNVNPTEPAGYDLKDSTFSHQTISGVAPGQKLTNISVTIDIQHTFDSDLYIDLVSPNGTTVNLVNREGFGGNTQGFINTTFTTNPSDLPIFFGSDPFTGNFQPEQPLTALLGTNVNNGDVWWLVVDDTAQQDTGTLISWTLQLSTGTTTVNAVPGNGMDQNANTVKGEPPAATSAGDAYAVPRPLNAPPFQLPYDPNTLPLIVPGPHVLSTFVPGQPTTSDNLVLNNQVNSIDVTFDRDMDPSSFTIDTVLRLMGPAGVVSFFTDRVQAQPAPNTVSFAGSPSLSTANASYNGDIVTFTTGANAGQSRTIAGFNSASDQFIFSSPWAAAPAVRDAYTITNPNTGQPVNLASITPDPNPAPPPGQKTGFYPRIINGVLSTAADPNGAFPRTFRINIPSQDLSGTYTLTLASTIRAKPRGSQTAGQGDQLDTNLNAGLDVLRGGVPGSQNIQVDSVTSTFAPSNVSFTGSSALSDIDNFYKGKVLTFTSGANAGLSRMIDSYVGSFREFTFTSPGNSWPVAPSVGDAFFIQLTTPVSASYNGPAVALPAGKTTVIPVTFPRTLANGQNGSFQILGATVELNITYPHDPDLEASLVAPDGTTVKLFTNVGNNPGSTEANFTNTILDDRGTTPIQRGVPPFNSNLKGSFNPQEPLGVLNGKNSSGTWNLVIKNDATSVSGANSLNNWSLTFGEQVADTGLGEPIADQATVHFRIFTQDPLNPIAHDTWTAVGPASINSGGNSGRIGGLAVDPSDPSGNTVYVAGASGGVWKTTNFLTTDPNGPTYIPLTDFGPTFAENIGSIAVFGRNNDPNQSIIFAATGEGDTGSEGVGIIRSMDGGATWTLLDSTTNVDASGNLTPINSPLRDHIFAKNGGTTAFKLVVDPTHAPSGPSDVIVYAAISDNGSGNGGLWRSLDSGKHWTKVSSNGVEGTDCTDVVLAAGSASAANGNLQVVYAAFRGKGVYLSQAQGAGLVLMAGGQGNTLIRDGTASPAPAIPVKTPASFTPNGAKGRIVLAAPALTGNPIQDLLYEGWVYAAVATPTGALDGIYLSKDFGANWTQIQLPVLPNSSIVTNDETRPNSNVLGNQGNYDISLAIDPTNPAIVYVGGTSDFQPSPTAGGLIRIDTTTLHDPHMLTAFDNDGNTVAEGPGAVQAKTLGAAFPTGALGTFEQFTAPDGSLLLGPAVISNYTNMISDPLAPFTVGSTVFVAGMSQLVPNPGFFNNDGGDASYASFEEVISGTTDQHRVVTLRDPVTGHTRLIFGDDQGVFTGVDQGNGVLLQSIGDVTDLHNTSATNPVSGGVNTGEGNVQVVTGSRNGNLQITQFYYGAAQPSVLAAEIAAVLPLQGGLFYGNAQDNGFPVSDPHLLTDGNIGWQGPLGDGTGIATDQTGTGTAYSYQWPCCGTNSGATKTNFFLVNPKGNGYVARTGTGGASLVQTNNDPQWPFLASSVGGGTRDVVQSNFGVNPIDGNDIIIGSAAGRIFKTNTQGNLWFQVGFINGDIGATASNTLDGTMAPALAYGAPDPADPLGHNDDFLYVGTAGGHVYVSLDGGADWTNISGAGATGLDGSAVVSISANPLRGSHELYAVTTTGVFHLTFTVTYPANGAPTLGPISWQNITGNVFKIHTTFTQPNGSAPVNNAASFSINHDPSQPFVAEEQSLQYLTSIVADWRFVIPNSSGSGTHPALYIGGEGGVYRSMDNGVTWTVFPDVKDDGAPVDGGYLPDAHVTDMHLAVGDVSPTTGQPDQARGLNMLVVTTYGRGDFAIRLPNNSPFNKISGPAVVSMTPTLTTPGPNGVSSVTVTFGSVVDPSTFDSSLNPNNLSKVTFTGPNGPIQVTAIKDVTPVIPGTADLHNIYEIDFAGQFTGGTYTITLGPNISDFAGDQMDQDADGVNGVAPEDAFTGTFVIVSTDDARFVAGLYQDILGRSADIGGFLATLGPVDAARNSLFPGMATAIITSAEARGNLVATYFTRLLGRPASSGDISAWVQALGNGLSPQQIVAALAGTPEYFSKSAIGQVDSKFVNQLYLDLLGRAADPGGQQTFLGILSNAEQGARTPIANTVIGSDEYLTQLLNNPNVVPNTSGSFKYGFYPQFLGRQASPAEIAPWLNAFHHGATDETVIIGLAGSQEYFNRAGQVMDANGVAVSSKFTAPNDQFVAALYVQLFGRLVANVSQGEVNMWTAQLPTLGFGGIVSRLIATDEYRIHTVQTYYTRYLGRTPAGNSAEVQGWVAGLRNGLRDEQIVVALTASPEYFAKKAGSDTMLSAQDADWVNGIYSDALGRPADAGALAVDTASLAAAESAARAQIVAILVGSGEFLGDIISNNAVSRTIAAAPTGATESGSTVTITTTTSSGLVLGEQVTISGVGVAGYNGTFTVTSAPTSTTFTYTASTTGLAPSGGGVAAAALAVNGAGYYPEILGRTGGPGEVAGWASLLSQPSAGPGHPTRNEQVLISLVSSQEFFNHQSDPINAGEQSTRGWLAALYENPVILNRPSANVLSDAGFQGNLTGMLNSFQGLRLADATTFANSPEFKNNLVATDYTKFLRRSASGGDIAAWSAALSHGLTDEALIQNLVSSQEYFNFAQNNAPSFYLNDNNSKFVSQLYTDVLGRAADAGAQGWVNALNAGLLNRAQVAGALLGGTEYLSDLVGGFYKRLLGRSASPGDTSGWVNAIQHGLRDEQVIAALASSNEYFLAK
jgi:sugar lactone lactonase YvrE